MIAWYHRHGAWVLGTGAALALLAAVCLAVAQ